MKEMQKKKLQPRIADKKLEGQKVYYLVVRQRSRKWMDFEHMSDYLQLVMEFQKSIESLNSSRTTRGSRQPSQKSKTDGGLQSYEQKIAAIRKNAKAQSKTEAINNIVFLNQVEYELFFKVYYQSGHSQTVSSKQLRLKYPQELISFYEMNVKVDYEVDKEIGGLDVISEGAEIKMENTKKEVSA